MLANRKNGARNEGEISIESFNQKLASLRSLSNKWLPQPPAVQPQRQSKKKDAYLEDELEEDIEEDSDREADDEEEYSEFEDYTDIDYDDEDEEEEAEDFEEFSEEALETRKPLQQQKFSKKAPIALKKNLINVKAKSKTATKIVTPPKKVTNVAPAKKNPPTKPLFGKKNPEANTKAPLVNKKPLL